MYKIVNIRSHENFENCKKSHLFNPHNTLNVWQDYPNLCEVCFHQELYSMIEELQLKEFNEQTP